MSGKGGVGKTTVAVNLAVKLSKEFKVGLLDIDFHGPNVPKMLGLEGRNVESEDEKIIPIKYNNNLKVLSISFLLENKDSPVIWRGALKHKVVHQFLNDVKWGELDYLIIDMPPGTGDEVISMAQLIEKPAETILVSTPQEVSLMDVKKTINFSKQLGIKIIGVIENMSGEIFGTGKVEKEVQEQNIPFLGKISLSKVISQASDKGKPFILTQGDSTEEFNKIIKKITENQTSVN